MNPAEPAPIRQISAPDLAALLQSGTALNWWTSAPRRSAPSPRSTARGCSIRRITMPCSSSIGIRRSSFSATTVSAASARPSTSSNRDSPISATSAAVSTRGRYRSIRRCLATRRGPSARRLRGALVARAGAEPGLGASDCRQRSPRHVRALPRPGQAVPAHRSDRFRRRRQRPRAGGLRRDGVRGTGRNRPGVHQNSRALRGGAALTRPESHDAARHAARDLGLGRRPPRLAPDRADFHRRRSCLSASSRRAGR